MRFVDNVIGPLPPPSHRDDPTVGRHFRAGGHHENGARRVATAERIAPGSVVATRLARFFLRNPALKCRAIFTMSLRDGSAQADP